MHSLTHFKLCPRSRSIRVLLGELGIEHDLVDERPWEYRPAFLALNPAGELPVLVLEGGPILFGAYAISEYFGDTSKQNGDDPAPLFHGNPEQRSEIRRLVDWFHGKLNREVTHELLTERIYTAQSRSSGRAPDAAILRAIRSNLRYHLSYLSYLAEQRRWLAGDDMSFADIAAAAHLSSLDYLGEVPWDEYPTAKSWYVRLKSRPSFRPLLSDRMAGTRPSATYADLDA